ncbi:hypothetical protein [Clostridium haemolyticum]|uniref:Uncharacterized protein n=1 Tax=Clostridium haemolyticum NCTC 9693 TaxID=1443114 RepID=A0ABR4TGY7_CLOHA|nr:hypothetical protein [Clostridium haemolyticum]KEI18282.1 hypothetical protein Z960_03995 [Clostridium haemolyticum NCTC 9693]KGN04206.1 hypothetical protein Z961_04465 [Clostridium haemolyticum NCTC 8350]
MSIWDIKTKIIMLTSKIVLEDNFKKRMKIYEQLVELENMLTEKMAKAEVNYKFLKHCIVS